MHLVKEVEILGMTVPYDRYIRSFKEIIKNNPLLTSEQEKELINTMRTHNNAKIRTKALHKLFNSSIRLVLKEAYHYCRVSCFELNELIGAGNEGLGEAIKRFEPKHNTRLSTYAMPWIKKSILDTLYGFGTSMAIPNHVIHKAAEYKRILEDKENEGLTDEELSKKLHISKKLLRRIKSIKFVPISLNDDRYTLDGDSTLQDIIPDPKAVMPSDSMVKNEKMKTVLSALNLLKPLERDVIMARYLDGETEGDKENLRDIGKRFGITGERVRQIEFKAFKILRKRLKNLNQEKNEIRKT